MTAPLIVGRRAIVPASLLLNTIGGSLDVIRKADGLTLGDVGAVLGKSEDQAGKYITGTAEMGIVSYHRAMQAWNGRFANEALALIQAKAIRLQPTTEAVRGISSKLAATALKVARALEDNNQIDDPELKDMAEEVHSLGEALDTLRHRLAELAAAA
jgi:hypothetical protein